MRALLKVNEKNPLKTLRGSSLKNLISFPKQRDPELISGQKEIKLVKLKQQAQTDVGLRDHS